MPYKPPNVSKLSERQLRTRRRRLARGLPDVEAAVKGSLQTQMRSCGKQGCRCARGEPHGPYIYLSVRTVGRNHLLYVPADLVEEVRLRVDSTGEIEAVIEEISAINLELLARGKLD